MTASTFEVLLLFLVGGVCWSQALAFEVSPLVHRLDANGRVTTSVLKVSNPSDTALPVEFAVFHLDFTAAGAVRGEPADDDLLVFPPASLLPPGGVQAVRIQWAGDPDIDTARSYFVTVEQVPVQASTRSEPGVQVLLTFNAVVHVTPAGASADLVVLDTRLGGNDGSATLVVDVENRGTANAYGSLMTLAVDSSARQARLTATDLQAQIDDLFFPPGFRRELRVRLPGRGWRSPVTAHMAHESVRH